MSIITPHYYKQFKCIANRCEHSCCIGWEIDVDNDTYETYCRMPGEFGDRLRMAISAETPHQFLLEKGERCPFLNEKNLCEIILNAGEDALCQICTDHPRFRTFYENDTEIGLGLCCEEAVRLILNETEPFHLIASGERSPTAKEAKRLSLREKFFDRISDRSKPIRKRLYQLMCFSDGFHRHKTVEAWADIYLQLEYMDNQWKKEFEKLSRVKTPLWKVEIPFELAAEQLLCYFLYRYFCNVQEDFDLQKRIGFCALNVGMIFALFSVREINPSKTPMEELSELVRNYSSEIEYSEENVETLLSYLGIYYES